MIPTCMFCGTLDEAANECPTCGGVVYDMERQRDRALVETYQAWLLDHQAMPNWIYVPFLGGIVQGVAQYLRTRKIRRELAQRFAERKLPDTPHSPYR